MRGEGHYEKNTHPHNYLAFIASRLKEDGFLVRILTRDGQKAKSLFGDAFEIVTGDPLDEWLEERKGHLDAADERQQ